MTTVARCSNCNAKNRIPAAADGTPHCSKCHQPLPWIVDADDETFSDIVEASRVPVLLDLWAPWCGPCRMVSPALEALAREHAGTLKLVKVNVDVARGIAQRFDARSIPTLVVLDGADVVARQIGAAPEAHLRRWLTEALGTTRR